MSQLYFDNKYKSKGGIAKLKDMMEHLETQETIANYFGVGKENVALWGLKYFGQRYDPRYLRRRKKVDEILKMFDEIGTERTILYMKDSHSVYIEQALEEYHGRRKEEKK